MNRSVKAAVAGSVLLAGVLLALLFRHESPPAAESSPLSGDNLRLGGEGYPPGDLNNPHRQAGPNGSTLPTAAAAGRSPTVLTPLGSGLAPPELPKDYPNVGIDVRPHWGTSIGTGFPQATGLPKNPPRIHRIVDGDTLDALAERYLGTADRAAEIYEANRDRLISPTVLPIGVTVEIPSPDVSPMPAKPGADTRPTGR